MNSRRKIIALGLSGLAMPLRLFAQQPDRVPRIGFLISETLSGQASRVGALRAGLRDFGYIEGKNINVEIRTADGNYDQLPKLAQELVNIKVDVLVAFGAKAVMAAKGVTTTVPIVVPSIGEPVALGLAKKTLFGINFSRSVTNGDFLEFTPKPGFGPLFWLYS